MRSTFSPLLSSYLGFDRLFNEIDAMLNLASTSTSYSSNYPPLNLIKEDNGDYFIEMALAGFRKEDLKIEHDRKRSILTIQGDTSQRKMAETNKPYNTRIGHTTETQTTGTEVVTSDSMPRAVILKQGIAARNFTRSFTIADDLEVAEAELADGLLTIKLRKIVSEDSKPLLIQLK